MFALRSIFSDSITPSEWVLTRPSGHPDEEVLLTPTQAVKAFNNGRVKVDPAIYGAIYAIAS